MQREASWRSAAIAMRLLALLSAAGAAAAAGEPSLAGSVAGRPDAEAVLHEGMNASGALRHAVSRMLSRSTEDMKSLKSLLTTNAKGTKAMNDILLEMNSLTSRMGHFSGSMERCRQQLVELQARDEEGGSDDPLLGDTALLQLRGHAERLRAHVSRARDRLMVRYPERSSLSPHAELASSSPNPASFDVGMQDPR
mmetsp:Transcript_106220/g.310519  ORF Transcript_106220/g.310519 Transcript_106220/m.310519 type:complete len:196 (-) Transcript_106220:125-712(-)